MLEKVVSLASLGLCEHCGVLLTMEEMPSDAINAEWRCFKCNDVLSHRSFGYDRGEQGAQKVKWVGPNGEWTEEEPKDDFDLGNLFVMSPPTFPMW